MRKLLPYFFAIGCIQHGPPSSDIDTEYWICRNEESIHHNRLCHDDCYVPGDPFKFCWLLEIEKCIDGSVPDRYRKACQVFEKSYHDQNN